MKKNQTQIKKYAAVISIFLAAVIVGLFVFFFCIKRSVEQRSKNTMRNNVVRQSEHLRTILDIQYDYLNALPEQAAQQSYNFIEDYEISFMIVFIVLVTLLILYIVYENHTRNKELLKYAQTDALTGLYNKETTEQLTDELLSEDENKYHAFLILDVDCFKQINDIYGHAVGDIVLQKFGKLLKGTFREGDILGRIGGDEFGVIMKNIQTKDIAMKKAEELLAKTQAYKIDELKGNNISISIGISTAPQDGDCYMDLYKRADQALYQAKRSGKARVCNYFS